ncbi:site-specific DNA-methyltransferase [Arthrobacter oryzae]|uniref:site-specific DNA-methyltransferase n=1 Tax=Arthrobacter oryzae TaxID=409290 RepID=UPI00273BEF80|nr:site-specific DNA-methyltransferase [Arthrobacter oryzae]WLQ05064.1 DNA methyltransferase [Arthrobacter oryzae]
MIRDAREANETASPNDFEIARLRAALPEYFDKDGGFMLDRLQEILRSDDVNLTREGFELKFLGKSYAKYLTSTRTATVVVPDVVHNAEDVNAASENLYIVGDNLDVLKHLLGSYRDQIKCIYIDPPYNTGSDGFVYNDDFGFTAKQLVEKIGLSEDEARRVIDLRGKSSHSAWLTFMYPRLELAKELLADEGVIIISIGDDESANLKLMCDEVFGEQNFVSDLIWQSRRSISDDREFSQNHTHTLVYSKDRASSQIWGDQLDFAEYANPDNDPRGPWKLVPLDANKPGGDTIYPVQNPVTGEEHWPSTGRSWAINSRTMASLIEDDRIAFGKRGVSRPQRKLFYEERVAKGDTKTPSTMLLDVGTTADGTAEVEALLGPDIFSHPKPVGLVKKLVEYCTLRAQDAIVLDFFSGSATTADSVMQLNALEGDAGRRKFIMVQLPEKVKAGGAAAKAGYSQIDQIGRDRIKRAASKIKNETGAQIDYGFRLFRLEEPSEKTLDELQTFDPTESNVLLSGDFVSKFEAHGTPGHDVVLSTWLLQDGFGLMADARTVQLSEYELRVCGDSGYVIQPGLTSDDLLALVSKLETGELDLSRLVVFGYSVTFSVMHELKKNLGSLKSGQSVSVIERF